MSGGISAAALALTAVGTAVSVYSSQQQAKRADAMADYQTAQARADSATAVSSAQVQARAIRKAGARQQGEARAALASSGVIVGEGTAEQIDTSIAAANEEDALMAIYDGNTRAGQIRQGGNISAIQSQNQASAARTGAWTSALQGGATIARGWNMSVKGGKPS